MATTPQPPAKPAAPAAAPAGAATPPAEPKAKPEPDPPVRTIADEQRQRSDEVAAEGVEKVKARLDQRAAADKPKQAPGVAKVEAAQNKTAP